MNQLQRKIIEHKIRAAYTNGFLHGLITITVALLVMLFFLYKS